MATEGKLVAEPRSAALVHPMGQRGHPFHLWLTHHMGPLAPVLLVPCMVWGGRNTSAGHHRSFHCMPSSSPSAEGLRKGLHVLLSHSIS